MARRNKHRYKKNNQNSQVNRVVDLTPAPQLHDESHQPSTLAKNVAWGLGSLCGYIQAGADYVKTSATNALTLDNAIKMGSNALTVENTLWVGGYVGSKMLPSAMVATKESSKVNNYIGRWVTANVLLYSQKIVTELDAVASYMMQPNEESETVSSDKYSDANTITEPEAVDNLPKAIKTSDYNQFTMFGKKVSEQYKPDGSELETDQTPKPAS